METGHIIVQAGGRGSRLGHLTRNKPKALVPVENLPMLFHLFRKYPDKRFIIIADYQRETLRRYLECFSTVRYDMVDAEGRGTCGGIAQALRLVPTDTPFLLIWSDLILPEGFRLPEEEGDYVGISQTFPCRWSYSDGAFREESSREKGVAGLFLFRNKARLADVPESGEWVRWLQGKGFAFRELGLAGTKEFGLLEEYEKLETEKCRPFNRISLEGDVVVKEGIDEQGRKLAARERAWYKAAMDAGIGAIPRIDAYEPLKMERIHGKNVYEYTLDRAGKRSVLEKLAGALHALHGTDKAPCDRFSMKEAYYRKTMQRLSSVRDLIPFADQPVIRVNGRLCRNVFFHRRALERALDALPCDSFAFIHGDCTFSNLMLRDDRDPVFIDPRGYFGYTEIYGDPQYDWAKLYYSIRGSYDRFNLKDFHLAIGEEEVELSITSGGWEDMEEDFFALSGARPEAIKLIHAVIWLSLTTYAWQDYDSICGAFYNGLWYLEEVL